MAKFKSREERTYTNEKTGKLFTYLTPSERAEKFACELKSGNRSSTAGEAYLDENNNPIKLSKEARAFRAGYLDAQKDSAKAYKHRMAKGANLSADETKEYKKLKGKEAKEYLRSHKKAK
ncbi:MAG: hypothetical protein IJZ04_05300 [Clostridia bacterium]|nr:hypothetical protein [Clostridia bacterium]MBQ8738897.1 hypothetical protein [Clostridia bacterium]